jgi:hypothetical protein
MINIIKNILFQKTFSVNKMSISFISSIKYGAQMKSSASPSLFTVASDTLGLDFGGNDPTLELLTIEGTLNAAQLTARAKQIAAKESHVYKAVNIPPLIAKSNGGRNTTAPQLIDYVNARTAAGVKAYTDPEGILSDEAYAATVYRAAVENFVNEKSLSVIPLNGTSVLTSTRISISSDAAGVDIALVPGKVPGNEYKKIIGSNTLPCPSPSYPGAGPACGGTFVLHPCPGNVSTQFANPIMSKTMSTSNFMTTRRLFG